MVPYKIMLFFCGPEMKKMATTARKNKIDMMEKRLKTNYYKVNEYTD